MSNEIHLETLSYALITEGTSDEVFIPILNWLLKQYNISATCDEAVSGSESLVHKIQLALKTSRVNLLFIHRDADADPKNRERLIQRHEEIAKAVELSGNCPPVIPIIPIRMTEAWLLFDEDALRRAVGNSSGKPALRLPPIKTVEDLPNPKQELFKLLQAAHNPKTKRQQAKAKKRKFADRQEVAHQIKDFSPLRQLSAFQALEQDLCEVLGLESQGR